MLPRFLLADNYEIADKVFVVQTIKPRFIVECSVEDFNVDQKVHWIDKEPADTDLVEKLLSEAEAYYEKEFEEIDALYDEEEDED